MANNDTATIDTAAPATAPKAPEDQVPINSGLASIVAMPIFRFNGDRIAPMSDLYFFDDASVMIFQRQLSLLDLMTAAQGFAGAACALLESSREGLNPTAGWSAPKGPIMSTLAQLKETLRRLEEEAAKFPLQEE
jgi:hypothetical protein